MITEEKSSTPHILLYFKYDLLNKKDKKSLSSICLLDLEKTETKKNYGNHFGGSLQQILGSLSKFWGKLKTTSTAGLSEKDYI